MKKLFAVLFVVLARALSIVSVICAYLLGERMVNMTPRIDEKDWRKYLEELERQRREKKERKDDTV